MDNMVFVSLLVLGLSLCALAQHVQIYHGEPQHVSIQHGQSHHGQSSTVNLIWGEYDCSCSYYCPSYGIEAGYCLKDNDYWGWGMMPVQCCVPAFLDIDRPRFFD